MSEESELEDSESEESLADEQGVAATAWRKQPASRRQSLSRAIL